MKYSSVKYQQSLKLARAIYNAINGSPRTHTEYADSFNKIGAIRRVITDNQC